MHDVLGPQHQVDRGLHLSATGLHVALEDAALLAHVGSGVLGPAALDHRDGDASVIVGGAIDAHDIRAGRGRAAQPRRDQHHSTREGRSQAARQDRGQRDSCRRGQRREQERAADANHLRQRTRHLTHSHRGQGDTAEGPAPAQELRQCDRGRERGPAAPVRRHQGTGRRMHRRERSYCQRPADERQIQHPHRRGGEPADAHERGQRSPAVGLCRCQQLCPDGHAHNAQRPESPRRHRRSQQRAGRYRSDPWPAESQQEGRVVVACARAAAFAGCHCRRVLFVGLRNRR